MENSLGLLDLGEDSLTLILKHLPVADILSCCATCRQLHAAAQDDTVWRTKALERYPQSTVRLEHYSSYQELVRDDNCEQASLLLRFDGLSSRYKYRRPDYYFECLVLGLEWHRAQDAFRLYIDARGEPDLRQPGESSLGFVVHRRPPPDRAALQRRLRDLQARRQQLLAELAAAEAADALRGAARLEHELALNGTQQQQAEQELAQPLELQFADLLAVTRPAGQRLLVDTAVHKLGYLSWDSLEWLLRGLPDSYPSKREAAACGTDLAFCMANPLPVMPHAIVDYEPCILLTLPPGASLLDVFRQRGAYAAPGALLAELAGEGPEDRAARWAHLPPAVLQRQPPWLV